MLEINVAFPLLLSENADFMLKVCDARPLRFREQTLL